MKLGIRAVFLNIRLVWWHAARQHQQRLNPTGPAIPEIVRRISQLETERKLQS